MRLTYKKKDGGNVSIRLKPVDVGKPTTIGRGNETVIRIDDEKCSRIHAAIRYWDGIFVLRDMHSNNGTFLNGKKIDVAKLAAGDVIKIGDTEIAASKDESAGEDTVISDS